MGFSIIDLFVEREKKDSDPQKEGKTTKTDNAVSLQTENAVPISVDVKSSNVSANIPQDENKAILDKLCSFMEKNDLPGPDYMELKKAANTPVMIQTIPDENTRFAIGYAALKANAPTLTKNVILNSIDTYIKILDNEEKIALTQLEDKRKRDVDDKRQSIENMALKIAEMQKQLTDMVNERQSMQTEVDSAEEEYNKNKTAFQNAVNLIVSRLKNDKEKLNNCLID